MNGLFKGGSKGNFVNWLKVLLHLADNLGSALAEILINSLVKRLFLIPAFP